MAKRKTDTYTIAERKNRDEAMEGFYEAQSKCVHNGVHIGVDCIVDRVKWKMVIYFRDNEGNITDYQDSSERKKPIFYRSKKEYELAVLRMHHFYAKRY